jgi:hypothetical protein
MMNWRDLIATPPEMLAHPQNTQNTQNRGARGIIAHSADIADRVAAEKVAPVSTPPIQAGEGGDLSDRCDPVETVKGDEALNQPAPIVPTIQAGSQITWTRGDGSTQGGVVDYLYVDETGTRWAFISIGDSWAAVNLKFVTLVEEGGQH